MTTGSLEGLFEHTLVTILSVAGPLVVSTMVVGLFVSILQAATQINESTLTFVPKLIVAAILMIVAGPWMLDQLLAFTRSIFTLMGTVAK